jgi:hypothetical protein
MVRPPEDIHRRGGIPISTATATIVTTAIIITTVTIITTAITATKRSGPGRREAACHSLGELLLQACSTGTNKRPQRGSRGQVGRCVRRSGYEQERHSGSTQKAYAPPLRAQAAFSWLCGLADDDMWFHRLKFSERWRAPYRRDQMTFQVGCLLNVRIDVRLGVISRKGIYAFAKLNAPRQLKPTPL